MTRTWAATPSSGAVRTSSSGVTCTWCAARTRTVGPEGQVGYSYTNASTGGAAYAIAIGTKPRRDAVMSLVTYRDARPVGVQWVRLSPLGDWSVGPWTPLTERAARLECRSRRRPTRAQERPATPGSERGPAGTRRQALGLAEVAGFEPARGFCPQPA